MDKVQTFQREKQRREQRRNRYKNWEAKKGDKRKKAGTDYHSWEFWEPETSEDSDAEIKTPDDPAFYAMEADIKKRAAVREERSKKSLAARQNGNAAFGRKEYDQALAFYTQACQERKDDKLTYSNRALTYLCKNLYKKALKDCNTAMDIFEFLEDGLNKLKKDENARFKLKVFLRRAAAYRELKDYEKATADLDAAANIAPNDKEITKQRKQIKMDLDEQEKAAKIIEQAKQTEAKKEDKEIKKGDESNQTSSMDKKEKVQVKKGDSNDFTRMTGVLTELRAINTKIQEEDEKLMFGDEEEDDTKKKKKPLYDDKKLAQHLATLAFLFSNTNKDQNTIFFREKKGVITVFKLMRYLATTTQSKTPAKTKEALKDCIKVIPSKNCPALRYPFSYPYQSLPYPTYSYLLLPLPTTTLPYLLLPLPITTTLLTPIKVMVEACDNDHNKEAFVKLDGVQLLNKLLLPDSTEQDDKKVFCF